MILVPNPRRSWYSSSLLDRARLRPDGPELLSRWRLGVDALVWAGVWNAELDGNPGVENDFCSRLPCLSSCTLVPPVRSETEAGGVGAAAVGKVEGTGCTGT